MTNPTEKPWWQADNEPDDLALIAELGEPFARGVHVALGVDLTIAECRNAIRAALATIRTNPPPVAEVTAYEQGRADERAAVSWRDMDSAPMDGRPLLLFARAINATAPVIVVGWYIETTGWIAETFAPNPPTSIVPFHWMPMPMSPGARGGDRFRPYRE
jgi:hypothetical protein